MPVNASQLLQDALELPAEDREQLAWTLLESLSSEPAGEGVSQAWAAEIHRRYEDYRAGRSKGRSWNEVEATLRARLGGR